MSGSAFGDLAASLALVLVVEGLAFAIFSGRLTDLLEQVREIEPERMRWIGLVMAVIGTGLYALIRS